MGTNFCRGWRSYRTTTTIGCTSVLPGLGPGSGAAASVQDNHLRRPTSLFYLSVEEAVRVPWKRGAGQVVISRKRCSVQVLRQSSVGSIGCFKKSFREDDQALFFPGKSFAPNLPYLHWIDANAYDGGNCDVG
jgi:hypothetical protein